MLTRVLSPAQLFKHILSNGVLQDHSVLQKRLRAILGADVTFADAYKKTGTANILECEAVTMTQCQDS